MTVMFACVIVLALCLVVAVYLAIANAKEAKRAWETLAKANDEAHRVELAKLFTTPEINITIDDEPPIKLPAETFSKTVEVIPRIESDPVPANQIHTHLRRLRESRGWTLLSLSERSGISLNALYGHEARPMTFKRGTLEKYEAAFGERIVIVPEPEAKPIPKVEIKPEPPKPTRTNNAKPGPNGAQLRALRVARGWSMGRMSRECGLSMGFLSRHENGGSVYYQPEQLGKLVAVFGDEITPKVEKAKAKPAPKPKAIAYPDRLAEAVHASINELLSDDMPQPLVSFVNGLHQVDARLWGDKTLTYRVPEGQTIESTCERIKTLAADVVSNPYSN
jgi:transcriptional regulator with XRE-family HTH domain